MKNLKVALIFFVVAVFLSVNSDAYDLLRLTTRAGKVYRDVQIIDADRHGLLFRHSNGIAKESFPSLSTNIRDMFEPVEDVPMATPIDLADGKGGTIVDKGTQVTPQVYIPDITLTMVIRRPVNQHPEWFCRMHPTPHNWPSHWTPFRYAHYLTNPICRAQSTQNFLRSTGLLPYPNGQMFHQYPAVNSIRFR